jgi:hypothetical protein
MDAEALGWGPCREDKGGQLAGRDQVEPSATTVSDCSIHDGGLIFHSAIGVWVGDAARNRIVHNQIWNFSYSGISCGWTWGFAPAFTYDNRIECNRIHSIGHGVLSDMGAIYTLGRQAGTTISRNVISNVHSYGYGGWGIYPDEGSSWMVIEDNVVCGTKCGGFHQHYGRDNAVRRNVFVDAIENQIQVSRKEFVRSVIFENNLVQGAGNGSLWKGAGWASAKIEHNVYAGDPGRPCLSTRTGPPGKRPATTLKAALPRPPCLTPVALRLRPLTLPRFVQRASTLNRLPSLLRKPAPASTRSCRPPSITSHTSRKPDVPSLNPFSGHGQRSGLSPAITPTPGANCPARRQ